MYTTASLQRIVYNPIRTTATTDISKLVLRNYYMRYCQGWALKSQKVNFTLTF